MEIKKFEPKQADYKGDGCAGWLGTDKNGKTYITIKILNSITIKLFKNEPKPIEKPKPLL